MCSISAAKKSLYVICSFMAPELLPSHETSYWFGICGKFFKFVSFKFSLVKTYFCVSLISRKRYFTNWKGFKAFFLSLRSFDMLCSCLRRKQTSQVQNFLHRIQDGFICVDIFTHFCSWLRYTQGYTYEFVSFSLDYAG